MAEKYLKPGIYNHTHQPDSGQKKAIPIDPATIQESDINPVITKSNRPGGKDL